MKKFIILLFIVAVQLSKAQNSFNCYSDDVFKKQMQDDPIFKKNQEQLERETENYLSNQPLAKATASATYIIPVVFHVVYTTAAGNISAAQIVNQINILNKEFNRLQADTILTPAPFKSLAAPFSVEFRLATKDPNGNCTNGINRIYNTLTNCSVQENDVKSVSYWPSTKYLNIWITQSMHYSGNTTCDGGGYAQFPGGAANIDGINIRGDLIGDIGTAATNSQWGNFLGRYLIHELGHWFNLRHIWGDATCGNDLVADTPPALASNGGCPSFPHNANNSCGAGASGEMFTDYMDYTNGPCLNMFSVGQVARMTAAINSPISGRSNLWTANNLNATGTNNPYNYPAACVAMPDILPVIPMIVCAGDSAKFIDNSYGGSKTSRLWNFNGNGASSLTDSIVKVKYTTPGVYSLSLTTNYTGNSMTKVFTNRVYVIDNFSNTNYVVPFEDSFEDPSAFVNEWTIIDRDNNNVTWEHNTSTAFNGDKCIAINNYYNMAPTLDDIISPAYNLQSVENPTLNFRLNYTAKAAVNKDQLQIFISKNCGLTWASIYQKSNSSGLKTLNAYQANSFTPALGSNEWRQESIVLDTSYSNNIVRFKFTFTSGGGNNIYLDDINLDGRNTTGIKNSSLSNSFSIFPNPANNELTIKFSNAINKNTSIEVLDLLGKRCLWIDKPSKQTESKTINLDLKDLENGVYFISIKNPNNIIYNQKFIKQSN